MTDRSKTVVMLIDWDNLQICHSRDAPGTDLDLQALIALAQSYGTLVSARAYAEWNLLSERLAVYKAGIEPVFAPVMRPEGSPREGKSLADTVMVADGVDLLWTVAPDVFVLATSDKDMIPLARIAKQRGAAVVVLGSDLTAIPLVEMSNVFITYRQLLRELDRVSELEAPVGRAPARERRLRESRRPSSEPYGGLGSGAMTPGPIGSGGRMPSRQVGVAAPPVTPTPLPSSRPSRRRFDEPVIPTTPVDADRALPAPVAPMPLGAETSADETGLGSSEIVPRRRRRRGGRGRRTGLGGVGDADLQAEASQDAPDDTDEGDGTEESQLSAASAATSPDDIDTAVLQLLASRDRETSAPDTEDQSPAETDATSSSTGSPDAEDTPRPARRVARTSFSSFGPPDLQIQPSTPPPAQIESISDLHDTPLHTDAQQTDAHREDEPQHAAPLEDSLAPSTPDHGSITEGLAPDAVVTEPVHVEPAADEAFPQLAPIADEESVATAAPEEPVTETASETAPSTRSSRSGRSSGSRRTRRPAASAAGDGEASTTETTSEAGEATERAPRRRRTRRPAASSSAEPAGEPVTNEAGA